MKFKFKRFFSFILSFAILLTSILPMNVAASELDLESDLNSDDVISSDIPEGMTWDIKDINIDIREETLTYIEDGINVRLVLTYIYDAVSKMETYNDDVLVDVTDFLTADECKELKPESEIASFDPYSISTYAYENRKFSKYAFQYRERGNTYTNDMRVQSIVNCLIPVLSVLYAPAGVIAAIASEIRADAIRQGYDTGKRQKLNYVVNKYWSHTTDGLDPVVYKTKYVYNFKKFGVKEKHVMYTYNNPI